MAAHGTSTQFKYVGAAAVCRWTVSVTVRCLAWRPVSVGSVLSGVYQYSSVLYLKFISVECKVSLVSRPAGHVCLVPLSSPSGSPHGPLLSLCIEVPVCLVIPSPVTDVIPPVACALPSSSLPVLTPRGPVLFHCSCPLSWIKPPLCVSYCCSWVIIFVAWRLADILCHYQGKSEECVTTALIQNVLSASCAPFN